MADLQSKIRKLRRYACATHVACTRISVTTKSTGRGICSKPRRARENACGRYVKNLLGGAQVIVVEDENGNIVRETMKDTDTVADM